VESVAELTAHVAEELREDRDEIDLEGRIGVALGVLPPGVMMADALAAFVGTEAQGYYDRAL
jgi:hypothetical protein